MNLIFVYNADSGVFNTLTDIAHKIFSPTTYECNLCNLTHGYFKSHDEWVNFLKDLDADIVFLHRDEFVSRYKNHAEIDYPAIFVNDNDDLKLWIDKEVIDQMTTTHELMEMIRAAILRKQAGVTDKDNFLSLPA